jgi:hypothetical protein
VLWLAPELLPYMDWVDLVVAIVFGIAAAWVSYYLQTFAFA